MTRLALTCDELEAILPSVCRLTLLELEVDDRDLHVGRMVLQAERHTC